MPSSPNELVSNIEVSNPPISPIEGIELPPELPLSLVCGLDKIFNSSNPIVTRFSCSAAFVAAFADNVYLFVELVAPSILPPAPFVFKSKPKIERRNRLTTTNAFVIHLTTV